MNSRLSVAGARANSRGFGTVSLIWIHGLLVLLCTVVGLSCLILAVRWVGRPFPGFLLSSDRSVHSLWLNNWPGVRQGLDPSHRLLAGDGYPIGSSRDAYTLVESRVPGSLVPWQFRSAGRTETVTLPVQRFTWEDFLLIYLPPFLAGGLILGVAAWIGWKRPAERAARVYLLISVLAAIVDFALFDSAADYVFTDLWVVSIALCAAPLIHLGLIFPREHPLLKRFAWLESLPYLLLLGLVLLAQITNACFYNPEVVRWFFILEITAPSLAILLLIALLGRSWVLAETSRTRRQIEAVGLGIGAGFGLPTIWALSFSGGHAIGSLSLILACFAAFPLSIGYAIVKHRLFEIGEAIRWLSPYTGVTLILGGGYLAVVGYVVPLLEANWLPAHSHWSVQPLLMILVGAAVRPLHAALQRAIDCLFYPSRYRREQRIAAFFRALQHGISPTEIVPALQRLLTDTFAPTRATVLLHGEESEILPAVTGAEVVLTLPMVVEKRLVGHIYLGSRPAGADYSQEDLDLLEMVATSGAIAIERARYASQAIDLAVKHRLAQERAACLERLNAIVNHELKGPLQLIRCMVADVKAELPDQAARVNETLDRISATARRQEVFVQRNLDRSALQAGELQLGLEPVNAMALLEQLLDRHGPEWDRRRQSVATDLPSYLPRVTADRDRLEHVLDNLLANAHKYTPAGGRIMVKGRADGRSLYLHVRDSGIGIAACHHERVFEPFGKLDKFNRLGTGLGLSICREYVRLMGGNIRLTSEPGLGSTFTVVLPLASSQS